jgi:DNA repair protein RadC
MSRSAVTLNQIPLEDRPRERLMQQGPQSLSNAELLAIILRTGTYSESAVNLAGRILSECEGLRELVNVSLDQLLTIKGIGAAKAVQIQACVELGRRLARTTGNVEIVTIRSPQDAADYMMDEMRYLQQEHFICLFLNTKNQITAKELISKGTLNAALVHPREVLRAALRRNSASIICLHNHPSGDPTPSSEDINLTKRLVEAGELVGIELLDHLIIGEQKFVSLKEQGLM